MIGGRSPKSAVRYIIKRTLARRRLAALELRNKIKFGPSALVLRRIEDAEVARLKSQVQLPQRKWQPSSQLTAAPKCSLMPSSRPWHRQEPDPRRHRD